MLNIIANYTLHVNDYVRARGGWWVGGWFSLYCFFYYSLVFNNNECCMFFKIKRLLVFLRTRMLAKIKIAHYIISVFIKPLCWQYSKYSPVCPVDLKAIILVKFSSLVLSFSLFAFVMERAEEVK